MSGGTLLSLLINLAVGTFFAFYYPRHVERQFRGRRVPPLFAALARGLRPVGYLLIAGSLLYGFWALLAAPD